MLQREQINAIKELQREAYAEVTVCEDAAWTYWACEEALALSKLDNVRNLLRSAAFIKVHEALEKNNATEAKYICRAVEEVIHLMDSIEFDNE